MNLFQCLLSGAADSAWVDRRHQEGMQKTVGTFGRPGQCLARAGDDQYADGVDSIPVRLRDDLGDVVGIKFIFHFVIPFVFPALRVRRHYRQQDTSKQTINCQSMREKISVI